MAIVFNVVVKDEMGESTIPRAIVELTYSKVGINKDVLVRTVADIHGQAKFELDTGDAPITWLLNCQDPRYFCSAINIERGSAAANTERKVEFQCISFIAGFVGKPKSAIVTSFKRAVQDAKNFVLTKSTHVLLMRNHVVNHHEYDSNQIYGGLIGRKVTDAYQSLATKTINQKVTYDTLYSPFVIYREPESRETYVKEQTEKLRVGLSKNTSMPTEEKDRRIKACTEKATREMEDLSLLVDPNIEWTVKQVETAYQKGVTEVEKLANLVKASTGKAKRQLLEDAQNSGAKSPFLSTTEVDAVDIDESVDAVLKYTVGRFKDGINLEFMLILAPKNAVLDFETEFKALDPDNELLAYNHRSTEKRKKDVELKEFGLYTPFLPLDGSKTLDGCQILKRCVLAI